MKNIEVLIEKISPEGKGIAFIDKKPVYITGTYPQEKVLINIPENQKHYTKGEIVKFIEKSKDRVEPKEDHFLICSPFQNLTYDAQIKLKKSIIENCFENYAHKNISLEKFTASESKFNYRTKIEYSFVADNETIYLGFHERESQTDKVKLENGCCLASEKMNDAALKIVELLNEQKINVQNLKSLTIRESKTENKIIAFLLLNNNLKNINITLAQLKDKANGIIIGVLTSNYPGSIEHDVIYQEGVTYLMERINDKDFQYSYTSFFQNNIEIYKLALEKIIRNVPVSKKIIELYSGVGLIGLSIADKAEEIFAAESNPSAIYYANRNAQQNGIDNYHPNKVKSEYVTAEDLEDVDVLIVDPPRSGMIKMLIENILIAKPKRIIYLSCDPVTQAKDYNLLKEQYKISSIEGYDFYPQTEHIESLAILDLK